MSTPTDVHGAQRAHRSKGETPSALAVSIVVGLCGSVGMVVTGTRIGSIPYPGHSLWWFSIPDGSSPFVSIAFYVSMGLLIIGWLGIGREAFAGRLSTGRAWLTLAIWGLPFFVGPPLFSRDIYSYIGQGLIARRGLNPYSVGPSVLGHGPLLTAIASVWRGTPSPYGPLFVVLSRLATDVSGSSLTVEIVAFRALELIGVVLIMVSLPRLARHFGTDPGIALWLGALSPLALLSFISSGHNDALMVGLLVAGVALAVDGRLTWGLALCALAATIKLPAAAAVAFLAVDQFRASRDPRRWRLVGQILVVPVVVFVGVTLACGYGWTWLSPGALHIPTELHTLVTPAISLGVLLFRLLHLAGIPIAKSAAVKVAQIMCAVGGAVGTLWLLINVHKYEVVRSLGLAFLLIVVASPTLWPWYLLWGVALLGATIVQRSKVLAAVAAFAMLIAAGPSGNPLLTGGTYVATSLAILAGCVWLARGQHWRALVVGHAT